MPNITDVFSVTVLPSGTPPPRVPADFRIEDDEADVTMEIPDAVGETVTAYVPYAYKIGVPKANAFVPMTYTRTGGSAPTITPPSVSYQNARPLRTYDHDGNPNTPELDVNPRRWIDEHITVRIGHTATEGVYNYTAGIVQVDSAN